MKTCIRAGVFETNSSSSHSLTIKSGALTDINDIVDNIIIGQGGEFGWGVETLTDFDSKFQYLITYLFSGVSSQDEIDEIVNNNSYYAMLTKAVATHLNSKIIMRTYKQVEKKYDKFGYIDHASYGEASDAFNSRDELANFLFNPFSKLHIDNDNH